MPHFGAAPKNNKYDQITLFIDRYYSTPSLIRTALYQIKTRSFGLLNLFRLVKSFIFMGEYISESHESELFCTIQGSIS